MKILNHNDKDIPVLHFQGRSRHVHQNLIIKIREQQIKLPNQIGIITFCNKPKITESPLIYQLNKNSIKYENPASDIVEWKNTLKSNLTLQAIDKIDSEYVLVLDSLDVVLTHKITDIVERFKNYNKNVLFGATKNNYPERIIDRIANRDCLGQYKYLNAGTCIGEKNKVKAFYSICVLLSEKIYNPLNSEQLVVRTAVDRCQDWVGFDYKCECFQTFSRSNIEFVNGQNILKVT